MECLIIGLFSMALVFTRKHYKDAKLLAELHYERMESE